MNLFMKNDKLLRTLRVLGILTAVWPLEDGASRLQTIFYKILLWAYLLNDICMIPALICSLSYYRNDFGNLAMTSFELIYDSEEIVSAFYCMALQKRFRKILAELKCPDDKCNSSYQEIVRRKYIFYARVVYICLMISYFIVIPMFILSPFILSRRRHTPLNIIYPLPMSETWARFLIYTLNIFALLQAASMIHLDVMITILLLNATFKFNLVGMQMRSVFTIAKLRAAIEAHQNVLNYVQEISKIVGFLILKSMINCANMIISGMLIIHDVPLWEIIEFFCAIFIAFLRLFIICWTAEMMTDMAYEVSWRIYDIPWMYATPRVRRDVCIILQRSQQLVSIKATYIIPTISVNICRKILCAGFSYFLMLRTILNVHM